MEISTPISQWKRIVLLMLLGVNYCMIAMNHALPSFHLYTPQFYCEEGNSSTHGCSTDATLSSCVGNYKFENHDGAKTIAAEWQLVCGRRPLLALAASLYYAGVTLGAVACGVAGDRWGRRPVLLGCLAAQGVLGVSAFFARRLAVFTALRFLQGFFVQGLQGCTYTYLMELFSSRARTAIAVTLEIFWATGLALLAACDYLTPDWRYLQLAVASPTIFFVFYVWWMPESPRWLSVHERKQDTEEVWNQLKPCHNKRDADVLPDTDQSAVGPISIEASPNTDISKAETSDEMNDIGSEKKSKRASLVDTGMDNKHEKYGFLQILYRKGIRKNSFVMMSVWFSVSLSYYGITFYLPALSGQRHFNFFLGAVIEVISYGAAFWFLTAYGCRRPLSAYVLLSGVLCVAVGITAIAPESAKFWSEPTRTTVTLLGKATLVSAFCSMFLYTSELFPTVLRAAAMGLCGFWGRIGSLTAPQLSLLGEYTSPAVPLVAMGAVTLAAGGGVLALPETHGQPLPDTVLQAQALGRSRAPATRL